MNNQEIRKAARDAGVKLWQVAYAMGMSDASFSRKLRLELTGPEKEKILEAIQKLKKEGK